MTDLARDLADLLARERASALRADLDDLEQVQADKRALFDRAEREGGIESAAMQRLSEIARANVGLIRQLVTLHRALAGLPPSGYGQDGRQQIGATPALSRRIG